MASCAPTFFTGITPMESSDEEDTQNVSDKEEKNLKIQPRPQAQADDIDTKITENIILIDDSPKKKKQNKK